MLPFGPNYIKSLEASWRYLSIMKLSQIDNFCWGVYTSAYSFVLCQRGLTTVFTYDWLCHDKSWTNFLNCIKSCDSWILIRVLFRDRGYMLNFANELLKTNLIPKLFGCCKGFKSSGSYISFLRWLLRRRPPLQRSRSWAGLNQAFNVLMGPVELQIERNINPLFYGCCMFLIGFWLF